MNDDEYGKVLDSVVVACVDSLVVCDNKVLLGKRTNLPNLSWWFFGGRMKKGETYQQAASRGLSRELQIEVQDTRFRQLGTYSLVWPNRREIPQSNGCHHLLMAMYVLLHDGEVKDITHNEDHSQLKWFDLGKNLPTGSSEYLYEIISDLKKTMYAQG